MAKRNLSKNRIISTKSVIQNLNTEYINSFSDNFVFIRRNSSYIWNEIRGNDSTAYEQCRNMKNGVYALDVRNGAGEHLATNMLLHFLGYTSTAGFQFYVPTTNDVQFRVVTDRLLTDWVYLVTSSNIYNYTNSLADFNSLKKEVESLKSQQNDSQETNEMKTQNLIGGGGITYSLPISYNYLNSIKRKEWLQHEA